MLIYSLAALAALWVFVCLWVAIPLRTVNESSWHYWILFRKPKGNCAYFWTLLISPIVYVCFIAVAAVVMTVVTFCRFVWDWLFMPVCGKHVRGALTKKYWKGFLEFPDERICHYAEFHYRNYWIGIIAALAAIAWISAGSLGWYNLMAEKDKVSELVGVGVLIWSLLTLFLLYCILSVLFEDSKKWSDFKEGIGFISGKLCHQLKYNQKEPDNEK